MLAIKFENEPWREKAKCKGEDPNNFFDGFEKMNPGEKTEFRNRTCRVCEVKSECRAWAMKYKPESGLFADEYWNGGKVSNTLRVSYLENKRDKRSRDRILRGKNLGSELTDSGRDDTLSESGAVPA